MINLKTSGIAGGAAFFLSFLLGLLNGVAFPTVLLRALIFAAVFFLLAFLAYFLAGQFLPELLDGVGGGSARRTASGSMVNITLNDGGDAAGAEAPVVPGGGAEGPGDDLGDISSLMDASPSAGLASPPPAAAEAGTGENAAPSGGEALSPRENAEFFKPSPGQPFTGLDQNVQDGYTEKGLEQENPFGEVLKPPLDSAPAASPAASSGPAALDSEAAGMEELLPDLDAMAGAFNAAGEIQEEPMGKPADISAVRRPSVGGKPSELEGDFDPKDLAAAIRDRLKRE